MSGQKSKRERTKQRIRAVALDLFETHGYDKTTTVRIAAAAGISEMTFFRHFASKDRLLGNDPYDPVIAEAVAAQPRDLPALRRVTDGFRSAWHTVPGPEVEDVRRRLRIAAATPGLLGTMRANTRSTEEAVVEALTATGTDSAAAPIAAAAVLAALTTALLEWAERDTGSLDDAVQLGLAVLDGGGR